MDTHGGILEQTQNYAPCRLILQFWRRVSFSGDLPCRVLELLCCLNGWVRDKGCREEGGATLVEDRRLRGEGYPQGLAIPSCSQCLPGAGQLIGNALCHGTEYLRLGIEAMGKALAYSLKQLLSACFLKLLSLWGKSDAIGFLRWYGGRRGWACASDLGRGIPWRRRWMLADRINAHCTPFRHTTHTGVVQASLADGVLLAQANNV